MQIEHNIYKLYIIKFAKWFMLYMPIIGLFYSQNGLSHIDLFIIQAGYSLASAVFEIPSGYLADVVGRKKTIVLGSCMGAFGFMIYAQSTSFWPFFIAEVLMGIGQSFISGSDSALLYDSLQQTSHKKKYLQYEGRLNSISAFAETLAALIGGIIATLYSLQAVFVVQVFIAALAIPASMLLVEPSRQKLQHSSFRQIFEISKFTLFTHKGLRSTVLLSSVIGIATLTMAWTMQSFLVNYAITEKNATILWVILNLLVAVTSLYASKLEKFFGIQKLVLVMVVCIPMGYIAMGSLPFVFILVFLLFFYIVRGFATPVLKQLIQDHCQSEIRATVLSVRGLLIRVGFSIVGPAIGYMSGKYNFNFAVLAAGILFLITSVFGYFMYSIYESKMRVSNCR